MIPAKKYICLTLVTLVTATAFANSVKVFPSVALTAKTKDGTEWWPVVGIGKKRPLIASDKGLEEVTARAIRCQRRMVVNDIYVERYSIEKSRTEDRVFVNVEIKSSVPLENAFAMILYTPEGSRNPKGRWTKMRPLTGGVQTMKLQFLPKGIPETGWTLHFFHGGKELYDPARTDLKDAMIGDAYRLYLTRHIQNADSGDANPVPFMMPISQADPELLPKGTEPYLVKVKIKIAKSGKVTEHTIMDELSNELAQHISQTVDGWWFLPRIKAGQPVATTVVMPLKLR
ncbi:MAG: energy transducer TonB [Puniceicoccaceae bacterium]